LRLCRVVCSATPASLVHRGDSTSSTVLGLSKTVFVAVCGAVSLGVGAGAACCLVLGARRRRRRANGKGESAREHCTVLLVHGRVVVLCVNAAIGNGG
jgi:hypothetical protein